MELKVKSLVVPRFMQAWPEEPTLEGKWTPPAIVKVS
jgi:hypothetical protein